MGDLSRTELAVLDALSPSGPLAGTHILDELDARGASTDPATLHRALRRLIELGYAAHLGRRPVIVPASRGRVRYAERDVFVRTERGTGALIVPSRGPQSPSSTRTVPSQASIASGSHHQ